MISRNARLWEQSKIICPLAGPGVPSGISSTAQWISLKMGERACVIFNVKNGASAIVGASVNFAQATNVSGAGGKAISKGSYQWNSNCSATDTLVNTTMTNNTFTFDATANLYEQYCVDIDAASDLDVSNAFCCFQPQVGNAANQTVDCTVIVFGLRQEQATPPSMIIN